MKDEIKEILDDIKDTVDTYVKSCDYKENDIIYDEVNFSVKQWNELLDYITNLQEEYEKEHYLVDKLTRQLTDEYKNTEYQCKQKEDYKSRIDKAIEYINNFWKKKSYYEDIDNCMKYATINEFDKADLLNILQGEDKE